MKRKTVILGTSEFSEYVYHTILKENQIEVLAFSADKKWLNQHEDFSMFNGIPVIALEDLTEHFKGDKFDVIITVGYVKMNGIREKLYKYVKELGLSVGSFISTRSICDSDDIGEGCIIMPTAYVPPCTKMGVCNIVNMGTYITHTGVVGDFNWFAATIVMGGNVKMGSNCFIGMGCTIKNGICVASNTFVGAGSYLSDDSEEGLAYMGSPAVNKKRMKSKIVIDFV